jgi:hypothetical protein
MVMGPIALVLLGTGFPALVKYPILALATYVGSNLLAYAYTKARGRVFAMYSRERVQWAHQNLP